MTELFSKTQWTGEFFLPELYENRFMGEIHYSPEEGVSLSYTITGQDVPAETTVLHGILSTGDKCTLIGKFSPSHSGRTLRKGLITRQGKNHFIFLAIGEFLSHDEQFAHINFSLTNLQEFFYPSGSKNLIKYSEIPIYSVSTPFGEMHVENTATFDFLESDIKSQIYHRTPAALDELSQTFRDIQIKYPQSFFMLKKDIEYRFFLKLVPTLTIYDAYAHIVSFSNLFALLTYRPVYPENIQIQMLGNDGRSITIQIYPSMLLDSRTIKLSLQNRFHWHMPITQSTVPFDSIVAAWLLSPNNYSPIVSSIQNETGFRNAHTVHGELVLYATQLESISHIAQKNKKYEYPLAEYGCPKLCDRITKIFRKSSLEEAAKAFGDLRNEIAHVGKPKRWLTTLSLHELVRLSQYIQLTVIGHIFISMGISKQTIINYQEKMCIES